MPPSSNSVGHGSVNDDNDISHADHAIEDSSSSQYETNMETLRLRREELDRQLQALENETLDATSRSGGSLDRDGGSTSSYAAAPPERSNIRITASTGSHSTQNQHQPYRPELPLVQSSGYPAPMPTTDEHPYIQTQRHQPPSHPLSGHANGGVVSNAYVQNSSTQSVGSMSANSHHRSSEFFKNGPQINTPFPFSPHANPYDQQFLAAAASVFHQQQQLQQQQQQQLNVTSGKTGTKQHQVQEEGNESSYHTSMMWKLLHEKEEELKELRQTLRETEQKFQEQSLLATKLQTTLDKSNEAFVKERLLIKLQAEREAQEALSSRQEELFQKQLQWMENSILDKSKNLSPPQQQNHQKNPNLNSSNGEPIDDSNGKLSDQQQEILVSNRAKKESEGKHPWAVTKPVADKEKASGLAVSNDGGNNDGREQSMNNSIDKNRFMAKRDSLNNKNLYPSINDNQMENGNVHTNQNSVKPLPKRMNQDQDAAQVNRNLPNDAPVLSADETAMTNNMNNLKTSMNESASSDRFDPVYVAQNREKDDDMAKDSTLFSNDDDRSLGQTVASSTYGDDRVKVVNKKLLDPYGDKGTYTGVVLRNTGMPHGLGRMVYEEDRRVFEGDWRHGRWHGYGRASFSNGDSYEGEYKFDQRHGTGMYRWNDGRVYDGQFSEDKRHGKGIFTWPDGAVYDGDFVNGQRQGHGNYTFADGGQYEGSWKDGRYDGFGTCTWEDGRRYRGEWRNGMAHGRGTETYPNGSIRHEGEWIDDEPIR